MQDAEKVELAARLALKSCGDNRRYKFPQQFAFELMVLNNPQQESDETRRDLLNLLREQQE